MNYSQILKPFLLLPDQKKIHGAFRALDISLGGELMLSLLGGSNSITLIKTYVKLNNGESNKGEERD